jgi:hypothetical protein
MNDTNKNTHQTVLVSECNTKKGVISVHHLFNPENEFYAITLNDNKSAVTGVLRTETSLKEALAFSRGVWMGIEILN